MSKGSCTFCGEKFDNVFEAADHLDEEFNPKLITSEHTKLNVGDMLYHVYMSSFRTAFNSGNENLKEWAEEMFSSLYIAEKRPEEFEHILLHDEGSLTSYVYDIVSEDSWKKLEEDVKTPPTRSFPTIPAGRGRFA